VSEVIALGGVGLVDCRVELRKSFVADGRNVGISHNLMRASHSLKLLNLAVIIGNLRERPAEAFSAHCDWSKFLQQLKRLRPTRPEYSASQPEYLA
jgi:hypothetical protein